MKSHTIGVVQLDCGPFAERDSAQQMKESALLQKINSIQCNSFDYFHFCLRLSLRNSSMCRKIYKGTFSFPLNFV